MRVKIGNTWYDTKEQPICLQFSEGEQRQIVELDRTVATEGKFAVFPEGWGSHAEMRAWMRENDSNA